MIRIIICCSFFYLGGLLPAFAQSTSRTESLFLYEVVPVGAPGAESRAAAINNLDWVVGEAEGEGGSTIAFVWSPDRGTQPLGTLGGSSSRAFGINDSGVVVGESEDSNEVTRAFRWTREQGIQPLKHPDGAFFSSAFAVNEDGQIVGTIEDTNGSHTVMWEGDALVFLQRLAGAGHVQPLAVNRRGDVVGQVGVGVEDDPTVSLAFYFPRAIAAQSLAEFSLVSALSGSSAVSVNEEGTASGYLMAESSRVRAFRYHPQRGLEMLEDRGALFSSGADINEQGWVAGSMIPSYAADESACVWRAGRFFDLNEVADTGGSWWLVQATAINNAGAMAGNGIIENENRAFMLRPRAGADPDSWPQPGLRIRGEEQIEPSIRLAVLEAVIPPGLDVRRVSFFRDGELLGSVDDAPFEWGWEGRIDMDSSVYIEVTEKSGRITRSPRQRLTPASK